MTVRWSPGPGWSPVSAPSSRWFTALVVLCWATNSLAQSGVDAAGEAPPPTTDSGSPPSSTPEVTPPEPLDELELSYPPTALEERLEGSVVLRLHIDAAGVVVDAEVTEPAGHGFDERALEAAARVRYRPAARGGKPIASRILTRVDFRLPAPPVSEAEVASLDAVTANEPSLTVASSAAPAQEALPPETAAEHEEEVVVHGLSAFDRKRESAEAVTIIDTTQAKREASDMGEVLARTQGVGVRRQGGLGSSTTFSLNGFTNDQVRFFLDGIPLELAGYPFGVTSVPVNLVSSIEIYSGVVPVRLGSDALGGGVNLVSGDAPEGLHADASYQVGSFDTQRVTVGSTFLHKPTGIFTRLNGFFDYAKNDYPIDVEVPDERGRLSPARVHRFHDAYRAAGGSAEIGLVNKPWARRLVLRVFETDFGKEYQHNFTMTVPYGEVTYDERSLGTSLRYEHSLRRGLNLEAVGGFAYTRGLFSDLSECVYDWFGRCVNERRVAGETDDRPHEQLSFDHSAFGRINLEWRPHWAHALRLAVAPTYLTRTGDELHQTDPNARDPLTAERKLLTLVNGLEYEADVFDDRVENIAFVKQYFQALDSEEPRPGGVFRELDRNTNHFGVGDGLRYRFTEWLYAKGSYEWATRLPRPDEVFGDNIFVIANLELEPETSQNVNLGATVDAKETPWGAIRAGVNGFYRNADNLIVLLGNDRVQNFQNVYGSLSTGIEAGLGWTSLGDYLVLDGNFTYQDLRNTSAEGSFGDFKGDRIPNRPYLFANGSARLQFKQVFSAVDQVSFSWHTHYTHGFYRGWESIGLKDSKQTIESQLIHTLDLGYLAQVGSKSMSTTLEVQNISDQLVSDFFGVQRPGRAFYLKVTAAL